MKIVQNYFMIFFIFFFLGIDTLFCAAAFEGSLSRPTSEFSKPVEMLPKHQSTSQRNSYQQKAALSEQARLSEQATSRPTSSRSLYAKLPSSEPVISSYVAEPTKFFEDRQPVQGQRASISLDGQSFGQKAHLARFNPERMTAPMTDYVHELTTSTLKIPTEAGFFRPTYEDIKFSKIPKDVVTTFVATCLQKESTPITPEALKTKYLETRVTDPSIKSLINGMRVLQTFDFKSENYKQYMEEGKEMSDYVSALQEKYPHVSKTVLEKYVKIYFSNIENGVRYFSFFRDPLKISIKDMVDRDPRMSIEDLERDSHISTENLVNLGEPVKDVYSMIQTLEAENAKIMQSFGYKDPVGNPAEGGGVQLRPISASNPVAQLTLRLGADPAKIETDLSKQVSAEKLLLSYPSYSKFKAAHEAVVKLHAMKTEKLSSPAEVASAERAKKSVNENFSKLLSSSQEILDQINRLQAEKSQGLSKAVSKNLRKIDTVAKSVAQEMMDQVIIKRADDVLQEILPSSGESIHEALQSYSEKVKAQAADYKDLDDAYQKLFADPEELESQLTPSEKIDTQVLNKLHAIQKKVADLKAEKTTEDAAIKEANKQLIVIQNRLRELAQNPVRESAATNKGAEFGSSLAEEAETLIQAIAQLKLDVEQKLKEGNEQQIKIEKMKQDAQRTADDLWKIDLEKRNNDLITDQYKLLEDKIKEIMQDPTTSEADKTVLGNLLQDISPHKDIIFTSGEEIERLIDSADRKKLFELTTDKAQDLIDAFDSTAFVMKELNSKLKAYEERENALDAMVKDMLQPIKGSTLSAVAADQLTSERDHIILSAAKGLKILKAYEKEIADNPKITQKKINDQITELKKEYKEFDKENISAILKTDMQPAEVKLLYKELIEKLEQRDPFGKASKEWGEISKYMYDNKTLWGKDYKSFVFPLVDYIYTYLVAQGNVPPWLIHTINAVLVLYVVAAISIIADKTMTYDQKQAALYNLGVKFLQDVATAIVGNYTGVSKHALESRDVAKIGSNLALNQITGTKDTIATPQSKEEMMADIEAKIDAAKSKSLTKYSRSSSSLIDNSVQRADPMELGFERVVENASLKPGVKLPIFTYLSPESVTEFSYDARSITADTLHGFIGQIIRDCVVGLQKVKPGLYSRSLLDGLNNDANVQTKIINFIDQSAMTAEKTWLNDFDELKFQTWLSTLEKTFIPTFVNMVTHYQAQRTSSISAFA